jgi:hypothetical protein
MIRCVHLGLLLALDFAEELRDETTHDAAPALRVHGVEGIYLASDGVRFARSRLTVRKDGAVVPLEAAR